MQRLDPVKVRLNQLADYIENQVKDEEFTMEQMCGSACCIAGHACILFGVDLKTTVELLGLEKFKKFSMHEEDPIWNELYFPDDRLNYSKITRAQAVKVIRGLAETGVVDWHSDA